MLKKLFGFLFDRANSQEKWKAKMEKTIFSLKHLDVRFPIIYWDTFIFEDMQVFFKPEDFISESIYGHWGLDYSLLSTNKTSLLVDSNGNTFAVKHDFYNQNLEHSFSFPEKKIGTIDLEELKGKIITSYADFCESSNSYQGFSIEEFVDIINGKHTFEDLIKSLEIED